MPRNVVCGLPGAGPADIWGLSLDYIEDALFKETNLAGAIFDLIKAYNTFSRRILFRLLLHLGLPRRILVTYFNALCASLRSLTLAGSISEGIASTTGVPEGCNLAVMCMLFLAYAFQCCSLENSSVTPFAYADNWALVAATAAELRTGIDATTAFCDAFSLQLALGKSWVWSLSAKERSMMKKWKFQGATIPTVLHERELGADVNYSKKSSNEVCNSYTLCHTAQE